MTHTPAISVIMSVRNNGDTLTTAIKSVLTQSIDDFEFLIMNDGSTDNTADILAGLADGDKRIVLFSNEKTQGLPTSLNMLASRARGRYLARMDGDDKCHPERFERQLSLMEASKDIDVCFTIVNLMSHNGEFICTKWIPKKVSTILACMPYINFFAHPTAMMRKSSFEIVGGYNAVFQRGQDWELWMKMIAHKMSFGYVREALLDYRLNKNGNSSALSKSSVKSDYFQRANILIQNKNRLKSIPWILRCQRLEFLELLVRFFMPTFLFLFMLKVRTFYSPNAGSNRLLSQIIKK